MMYYFCVIDTWGWDVYQVWDLPARELPIKFLANEPFQFVTTCKDNAVAIAKILRERNKY